MLDVGPTRYVTNAFFPWALKRRQRIRAGRDPLGYETTAVRSHVHVGHDERSVVGTLHLEIDVRALNWATELVGDGCGERGARLSCQHPSPRRREIDVHLLGVLQVRGDY